MEDSTKQSIKIILNLYKNDRIIEEEVFTLLDCILSKERTSYYPITVPCDPQPWKNPWDTQPWYYGEPYCNEHYTTTTTNKVKEEQE